MTVLTVGVTAILGKNIWNPRQKVLGAKAARNPLETLGRDLIKWVFALFVRCFFLGIKRTKSENNFYQKTHHYSCNCKQTWLVSFSCTNVQIVSKELNRKVWEVCPLFFSYKLALAELPQHPSVIYEASLMFARNIFSPRWLFLFVKFWSPLGQQARQTKVPLMYFIHPMITQFRAFCQNMAELWCC